ncbi:hypothetical protein Poli38472_003579 [Pythium oligandrum]|uniref:Uncharacterized protein n=1 Tax=Pythium oligandrum TaxID=41045 RepID=A0A8K1CLN9_PYTOL|nr:hypothetical protein Poli38472_003579 [Pythium oligandrum]|eukprot:TMW65814.1 hypothetical protein Poli38472_003579 [Pythium oligandrum]
MPIGRDASTRLLLLVLVQYAICYADIATDHVSSSSGLSMSEEISCSVDDRTCRRHATDVHEKHVLFVSIAIKSHALPLLRIASEMKQRGYSVSFATHESGREWVLSHGLAFVSAGAFPISADDLRAKLKTMTWDSSNFRGILTMFNDIYVAAARPMFDELLPQLQDQPPALIVMDIASIGAQDLAHKLGVAHIVNSPTIMFDLGGAPSYVPAWGTGFSTHMSLWNRCLNLLFPRLLSVALTPPFMQLNKMRWELDLKPYRSQHDIFKGTRVLLNTAFGLEHPQPLSPLIEPVGPILPVNTSHSQPHMNSALSSWFQKHGETSHPAEDEVVVYMNLGTLSYIDAWQAEALVDGLTMRTDAFRLKVLWVLPSDQRNVLPINMPPTFKVKSPNVVSSLDVLAHPAVRVVISHCGMVSAQEALVYHKPLLCIPFIVDQPDVAARVVDAGAGLSISKNMITAGQIHDSVVTLLRNASYTKNARRVGQLLVRAGGTHRAIEVIDASLRLGTRHLETLDISLPWHKTAMLDVWTVYIAVFCLLAMVIRVQWLLIYFVVSETFAFVGSVLFGPPESPGSNPPTADGLNGNAQPVKEEVMATEARS